MDVLNKLGRLVRLGGIVGLAVGTLALSVCTRSAGNAPPGDLDAETLQDAAVDAADDGATIDSDAGVDASSQTDAEVEQPDARLWDVLCE